MEGKIEFGAPLAQLASAPTGRLFVFAVLQFVPLPQCGKAIDRYVHTKDILSCKAADMEDNRQNGKDVSSDSRGDISGVS